MLDLDIVEQQALHHAYTQIAKAVPGLKIMLASVGQEWKVNKCNKAQMSWAGIYAGVSGQRDADGVNPYL